MASSSAAAATESLEVPPLPPKLRGKPQQRGNIGEGKLYADQLSSHCGTAVNSAIEPSY